MAEVNISIQDRDEVTTVVSVTQPAVNVFVQGTVINQGGEGGSSSWGGITGTLSNQTDLNTALTSKAPLVHTHVIGDVTGLQIALNGKQASGNYITEEYFNTLPLVNYDDLSNGLALKADTVHSHSIAQVTGLQGALDGKQATGDYATNTALTTGLATKANTSHSHAISDVTGLQSALDAISTDPLALATEYSSTTPTLPSTGIKVYSKESAGANSPTFKNSTGDNVELGGMFGAGRFNSGYLAVLYNQAVYASVGLNHTVTAAGSSIGNTADGHKTSLPYLTFISSGAANSSSALAFTRYLPVPASSTGRSLLAIWTFGLSNTPSGYRFFCGVGRASPGSTVDPSAFVNMIGVGKDAADTNLQFMVNDGSGTATKTDTGFALNTTSFYELRVYVNKSNSANWYCAITDMATGTVTELVPTSTNVPATVDTMPLLHMNTGAGTTAVQVDFVKFYYEIRN